MYIQFLSRFFLIVTAPVHEKLKLKKKNTESVQEASDKRGITSLLVERKLCKFLV